MATDRSALRSSLKRKTDHQLTDSGDQDTYLNIADRLVQSDWSQFDPSILRYSHDSGATDANGVLLMDANFVELENMVDSNNIPYPQIEVRDRTRTTGYYFMGWGNNNTQRQIQVMRTGSVLASTTLYWDACKLSLMGSGTTAEPVIPEEFRELLAVRAAVLWYEEQGTPMISASNAWMEKYEAMLNRARRAYRSMDNQIIFARSLDADAGGGNNAVVHITT